MSHFLVRLFQGNVKLWLTFLFLFLTFWSICRSSQSSISSMSTGRLGQWEMRLYSLSEKKWWCNAGMNDWHSQHLPNNSVLACQHSWKTNKQNNFTNLQNPITKQIFLIFASEHCFLPWDTKVKFFDSTTKVLAVFQLHIKQSEKLPCGPSIIHCSFSGVFSVNEYYIQLLICWKTQATECS